MKKKMIKHITYKKLVLIGSISLVLSIVLAIMFHGQFLFLALASLYLANWSGHQEQLKEWNHGICKDTGTPWEFLSYEEYTETIDYSFYAGSGESYRTLLVSAHPIYGEEYKGTEEF